MKIKPLRKDLEDFLIKRNLVQKFIKQKILFEKDYSHPSLNTEKLKGTPSKIKIYYFRLDKKYRCLFFVKDSQVEIFDINCHYD
jgi:Txe/YoeB family toxin of Txe-Axe toxin-antitoxin module